MNSKFMVSGCLGVHYTCPEQFISPFQPILWVVDFFFPASRPDNQPLVAGLNAGAPLELDT
jgi:hypothetical protein